MAEPFLPKGFVIYLQYVCRQGRTVEKSRIFAFVTMNLRAEVLTDIPPNPKPTEVNGKNSTDFSELWIRPKSLKSTCLNFLIAVNFNSSISIELNAVAA